MSLINEVKYKYWLESHSWDSCKLELRKTGEFLANYLVQEKDGFVLSLNGKWGTGKTEFLKRFYVYLAQQNYPVIYINSWESDFTNSPLEVIASEFISQLQLLTRKDPEKLDRLKNIFGGLLKGVVIAGSGILAKAVGLDSDDGRELAKSILDVEPENVMDNLLSQYSRQTQLLSDVKQSLTQLSESVKSPIFVLVDELDRCRPSYAIEFLEVIKHLFETPGIVFVVANDTSQLQESIKVLYGEKFDSEVYLRRFFNRVANLPEVNIEQYLQGRNCNFEAYENCIFDDVSKKFGSVKILSSVSNYFDLKLRDVESVLSKTHGILRYINSVYPKDEKVPYLCLFTLIFLIAENHVGAETYNARGNLRTDSWIAKLKNESFGSVYVTKDVLLTDVLSVVSVFSGYAKVSQSNQYGQEYFSNAWPDEKKIRVMQHNPRSDIVDVNIFSRSPFDTCININPDAGNKVVSGKYEVWFVSRYKEYIELSSVLS